MLPRARGGDHDPSNLVTLCSVHHTAAHEGRLVIRPNTARDASTPFLFERAAGLPYGTMTTTEETPGATLGDALEDELHRTMRERRARESADRRVRLLRQAARNGHAERLDETVDAFEPTVSDSAHVSQARRNDHPPAETTPPEVAHVSQAPRKRPEVSRRLGDRVVRLLHRMGYSKRVSTALVEAAIAGDELPLERPPSTEELLRAALRCG